MKKISLIILLFLFSGTAKIIAQVTPTGTLTGNGNLVKVDPSKIDPKISTMLNFYDKQIYFAENRGQWPDSVLYRADFPLGQALVTSRGIIVGSYDAQAYAAHNDQGEREEKAQHDGVKFNEAPIKVPAQGWLMNFVNHSDAMHIEGKSKHSDYFNYFEGTDASKYATNVNTYQEIWYKDVYNNVDVRYYPSATGTLEYDIVCKPGFNKNDIALQLTGIDKMSLKNNGHLVLSTTVGDMEFPTPVAYQKINGVKTHVDAKYVLKNNILTFEIGNYDETQPLIIDPIALRWATWMTNNSTQANHNHCIWVDQSTGYIYVIARQAGTGLITANPIQNAFEGATSGTDYNNEIAEYIEPDTVGNPGERVWQTWLGGSGGSNPYALEQAANGDLIFAGVLSSGSSGTTVYPLSGGAYYSNTGSPIDDAPGSSSTKVYVTKINVAGNSFKSAIIGGNGNDAPYDIRTTANNDILVCGYTSSTNLATIFPGSGATNKTGNGEDVLVFRLSNNLDTMTWLRNYGGTGTDIATIMNTNQTTGDIFVAGYTNSTAFPVSSTNGGSESARQSTMVGTNNSTNDYNGFVQKLDHTGNIVWSSYFTPASGKSVQILCMELNTTQTSVYFAGLTTGLASTNISKNVIQPAITGTTDFFVTKMDTNQNFDAATYLGGGGEINMMGLNTDLNNDVYILGYTSSTAFPITSAGALQTKPLNSNSTETFTKIRTDLDSLDFSTYFGGSTYDYDPVGERGIKFFNCRIFTVFTSESSDVPLTEGAITTNKLSSSSIYEPGICVWANPPDLSNNTITTNQQICKGTAPSGFTGSVPSYVLPNIDRNGTTSSYPVTLNSATTFQWQYSIDSVNWNNVAGGTTQNLSSTQIGALYQTTYFRRIIGGDACIIAGAAEQTVTVKILTLSGNVNNVSCYGANNGSITAIVTNGTPPYSYAWNTTPIQTTQTISNLSPGNYTVVVTNGTGCTDTASFSISQPAAALMASTSSTAATCLNNNGTASVVTNGGTQPYTYSWNTTPVQTTATATGLVGGTYTITVTDANGCSFASNNVVVYEASLLSAAASATNNVSCAGGNNGVASVNISGGTPSYTYSWNTIPAQTTQTASGLSAGTYTVNVTDANGCTASASVTINQPQAIVSASITAQTNVLCYGNNTGSATAVANGGTGAYTYSWNTSPIQTTATATNLSAGTYTVTVTDFNGCTSTASVSISQPQATLSASIIAQTNVLCYGDNTGSATVSATGGTGAYTYSWNTSPVQTAATASSLSTGTYTVTVTDANGCAYTASVNITQPKAAIKAAVTTQSNVLCYGDNTGSATVKVEGGTGAYTYSWNTSPKQTTATASGLSIGTYTVTVADHNGCETRASVIISQPLAVLSASISSQIAVSCFGNNTGSATVSISGGTQPYTYSWNTIPAQITNSATGLSAGTYTASVTDANGCATIASIVINQPQAALSASVTSQIPVSCFGNSNGSATASVNGGTTPYTYSWNTQPAQTTAIATGLAAGTYTVSISDSNGCATTTSVVINQPLAALSASISSQVNVSCFGGNGSATTSVSGGTTPYTYLWNTQPAQTAAAATGLAAGTYTVSISDSNGCATTASVVITQPLGALNASVNTQANVLCYGDNSGSATVTANAGTQPYTYSWNTQPAQTTATATGLAAGNYIATVMDSGGCITTATVVISQPQAALSTVVSASSSTICNNSPTTISALTSGGTSQYSYSWIPGGATTDTITVNPSASTTYIVTVTDANNCSTTGTITINVNQLPVVSVTATSAAICNGNSDTLSASGATSYSWSPATSLNSTEGSSIIANPSTSVTYTVTGTDENGCSNIATAPVIVNPLPTVTLAGLNPTYCANSADVILQGIPPAPAPYGEFSGNTIAPNSALFSPDSAGVGGPYTITYTYKNDTTGCSNSASLPVTILAVPDITVSPDSPAVCSGIEVTLSASGASSYSWSPSTGLSATTGSSVTCNATATTTYTATGIGINGCQNSSFTTVTINTMPVVTIAPVNPNICLGNSVVLDASGGTTYTWSPAAGLSCTSCSSTTANPTTSTQYIVDVSNGKCSSNDTITVDVSSVTVTAGNYQKIYLGNTAQLVSSGASSYSWTPGNSLSNDSISDPIASPTVTTTYTVTGRDSLGCFGTDTVVIVVINPCESLMLPSGFTPGGTANRFFHVLNVGDATLEEFRVYDRWGEMMYETNNITDQGWDGTFNGKQEPMGTYVYYAEMFCEGKSIFVKGNVTLIR